MIDMVAATKERVFRWRSPMTNDELWSHCDGPTECPDCTSETVIVDVSGIVTDPSMLSNRPPDAPAGMTSMRRVEGPCGGQPESVAAPRPAPHSRRPRLVPDGHCARGHITASVPADPLSGAGAGTELDLVRPNSSASRICWRKPAERGSLRLARV